MDEPQAPAVVQDSPTDVPAPETNWEQRYTDTQAAFTRASQEAATLRAEQERLQSDPDAQREFLQRLGYEIEEPEQGYQDPATAQLEKLAAQVAAQEQRWEAMTAEQQQAQQLAVINASVEEQFRSAAPDLDPATRDWVETRALGMPAREDGMPDIKGALDAFSAWETARQKEWAKPKRSAPRTPPSGTQGNHEPFPEDLSRSDLAARMAEEVMARNAQ